MSQIIKIPVEECSSRTTAKVVYKQEIHIADGVRCMLSEYPSTRIHAVAVLGKQSFIFVKKVTIITQGKHRKSSQVDHF